VHRGRAVIYVAFTGRVYAGRGAADVLLAQRTGDRHGSHGRRGPAVGLESRTCGRVLELGPATADWGARRSHRSRGRQGTGWANDSGGKEETGADFLETHCESCFSENRHARVFAAAHKRTVTKRQKKAACLITLLHFGAKNRIKFETKRPKSGAAPVTSKEPPRSGRIESEVFISYTPISDCIQSPKNAPLRCF
jgi:hypothetical protein